MFKKKEKKSLNLLELTPQKNKEFIIGDNGKVTILIPRFKKQWAIKLLRIKEPNFNIHLDDFGSTAWNFIDGKNSFSKIADMLVEKFGEEIQPIDDRLAKFITQLYNNSFISFLEIKKEK